VSANSPIEMWTDQDIEGGPRFGLFHVVITEAVFLLVLYNYTVIWPDGDVCKPRAFGKANKRFSSFKSKFYSSNAEKFGTELLPLFKSVIAAWRRI
jgi:hypothetical protein